MTLLQGDPITQLAFSIHENKGVFAMMVGSGLSRTAEIPTGWEVTLDLIRRVAAAQGVEDQPDWAAWYRERTGEEPSYAALLGHLAGSLEERRAILHRYIEPTEDDRREGKKVPTAAHHAIAKLVRTGHIRVIVTTNFDRLMENALRERGIEPTVISSVDGLAGAEPLTHSRCYVLKLHGDYKDARILNTDQELASYHKTYNQLLDRIFDEHGLIICGWSGEWDHALRRALLRAPNRRYPVYWAARGELTQGAAELVAHRRAKKILIAGADEFFNILQQRVETLEHSRRQNPLSVELLVSSAKRLLARPESKIQLDELFGQETERLLIRLEDDAFSTHGVWSEEDFRKRVQLYESYSESLGRMAGVLGRWGDGSELALMQDIIRAIHHQAEKRGSGLRVFLELQSYPAVLIFVAYSIGLTKARRWGVLHNLFMAALTSDRRAPKSIVSTLFLSAWEGGKQELWQRLEGLKDRKTPLSDHLLEIMMHWQKSFVGVDANFEVLFERFEVLGSLAYFEENDEAQLEEQAKDVGSRRNGFAWMPMGRAGWHSSSARLLLHELEDEQVIRELLQAGYAKNSRRFLELFTQNFKLIAERMSW